MDHNARIEAVIADLESQDHRNITATSKNKKFTFNGDPKQLKSLWFHVQVKETLESDLQGND